MSIQPDPQEGRGLTEPSRFVSVRGEFDVIVCGAGPAGVAAALSAARSGAKTMLIELHGCLGGVWTAGALSWVIDAGNKGGIMKEITELLASRGARLLKGRSFAFDVEIMKLILEELMFDAGVRVRLHTRVVAVSKSHPRRIEAIITESKSGREAWGAKVFIDTTGDGDLAALSGCGYDMGAPETGVTQPMSLIGLVAGVKASEISDFVGGGVAQAKVNLLAEIRRGGCQPSYESPTLFPVREDFFALMANHIYGPKADNADDVTAATLQSRAELHRVVDALRSLGGPWRDLRLVATAAQIGVREGRRIHGLYSVTQRDLMEGSSHTDAVCRCTFGIDVHSTTPGQGKSYDASNQLKTRSYDIPLRALIARDIDNLLMAGRCISGDFIAHSSYRVTGNAVAMGEAAGTAAAAHI